MRFSFGCRSGRESPRLGIRTSEERPEERREEQQVRDVSDNSHRPSVEPVARGGSPRGIPRGRRRRAPSPRSGRRARIYHPEDCEPRAVGPIDVLTPRRAAFHLREATRYSSSRSRCHSSRTESEFCARAPGSACLLGSVVQQNSVIPHRVGIFRTTANRFWGLRHFRADRPDSSPRIPSSHPHQTILKSSSESSSSSSSSSSPSSESSSAT